MKPYPTALLIDAERAVRRLLQVLLEAQRYKVFEAETGGQGIQEAVARQPDIIILEVLLPDIDGVKLIKQLREWNRAPILILSAENDVAQKVLALDSGANDFMAKPFESAELLARIRVLLRASASEPDSPCFLNNDLRVDPIAHITTIDGRRVEFTPTEEALFYTLARYPGHVVPVQYLVACVWGGDSKEKIHDLHVYIRNIRRKLRDASDEILIRTEGSIGYSLAVPSTLQKTSCHGISEPLVRGPG
jgi:two-component system KDP operon response regulator KdpE